MGTADRDKLMWIEIRDGLLGFRKALTFTTNRSAAAGIALSALGRIIRAIERRWDLTTTKEPWSPYDHSTVSSDVENAV